MRYSIYRIVKPADAVDMSKLFTGGVHLTMAILTSFLGVYQNQEVLGYFLELRLNFIQWLIDCKKEGTIPHVYIDVGGPCVDWYRSDTGEPIMRTTIFTDEYIQKAVHFAASFGVIIDNAWQGERGQRSGPGWWFTVPERGLENIPYAETLITEDQVEVHA